MTDEPLDASTDETRAQPVGRVRGVMRALAVDRSPFRVSDDFRRLWWAELVSQFGHQITVVAVFVQVFRLTGSPAMVGLVGLVQFVPLALATLVGGPMIDRLDRRKILLVTQAGFVATSATLLVGASLPRTPLGLIYAAAAVSAALSGIASPTRGAIVPNLIPRSLLPSAVALNQVMWNGALIAGPAVGGVIIAKAGVATAYGVDVATYAATIYAAVRLPAQRPRGIGEAQHTGLAAIREALRFVGRNRVLQGTFIADLIAMIFGMPRALFPVLAVTKFHQGAEAVGAMFSSIAVGGIVAALTAGWVGRVRRQGLAVVVAITVWGTAIALFGLTTSLPVALVLLAVGGTADVISAVFRGTILQSTVTDAVRGRLSAIHILVVTGGPRLGDLEAGIVASAFSPTVSVVSGGLACVAGIGLLAVLLPRFTGYRARAGPAPA